MAASHMQQAETDRNSLGSKQAQVDTIGRSCSQEPESEDQRV